MHVDREQIRANVRKAATEDLLDRTTIYRAGMEVEALDIIERELRERGVGAEAIAEHERQRREGTLFDARGIAVKCHKCSRPAAAQGWKWHRLWGILPLFPRRFAWCEAHKPTSG